MFASSGSVVSICIELADGSRIEWRGDAPGFNPVELVPNEAAFALCDSPFKLLQAICGCVSVLDCGGADFIRQSIGSQVLSIGSLDHVMSVTVEVDNSSAGEGWESGGSTYRFE